ncbi:MAG: S41 family peptidase [Acidobacteria bacterium]|nr:S41 family peptidase [Acidobacteriota bacterium]
MRLRTRVLVAVAVIGLGALAGAVAGERTRGDHAAADSFLDRYTEVLRLVADHAPLKTELDELVYSSLDGMVSLLDPHTNFLHPDAFNQMRERQQGSFHGIGVIISLRGGKVTVITPIEGTPAARLGLRAGDIIEAVDGDSTENLDLDDVAKRLRGPEGSKVTITISRPGLAKPLDLTIERAKVPTDSVRYAFVLGGDTAYVRVADFTRNTGAEVLRAVERLQKDGATRLLLDLRDNPGGIVDSAVEIAGLVLQPGQQVFSTKGRTADSFQDYRAERDGLHFAGPVVVLVNRGSASAAEIVAGAIQDHDRGLLVGEVTFGKGVVQTIYPVRDAGLALTTAKYYTPSGRCIQRDFDSYFTYVRHAESDTPAAATPAPEMPAGEVFFTDSGRKVYGGGGIVPDRDVRLAEYSERVVRLLGQSAFFQFAVTHLVDKPNKATAAREFAVTPEVLKAFRDRVVQEKWLPAEEIDAALADPIERRDIELGIHAEVMNAGVGLAAGYRVLTAADEQIQAGLTLFDEAAQLHAKAKAMSSTTQASRRLAR